jgi:hypothetical protein
MIKVVSDGTCANTKFFDEEGNELNIPADEIEIRGVCNTGEPEILELRVTFRPVQLEIMCKSWKGE